MFALALTMADAVGQRWKTGSVTQELALVSNLAFRCYAAGQERMTTIGEKIMAARGGGGGSNLTFLYTTLKRKGTFHIPSIEKGTPFI